MPTPGEKLAEVCLYVVSMEKLKTAYEKCSEAGLVEATWEEVENSREFSFSRCPDPSDQKIVLELRHRLRAPEHQEWPLPKDLPSRAVFSSPS